MTVLVDLKFDKVDVEGSLKELKGISMDKESYIRMFAREAKFFVDKQYFESQGIL